MIRIKAALRSADLEEMNATSTTTVPELQLHELYRDRAQIAARLFIGSDPSPENPLEIYLPVPYGERVLAAHPDLVVSLIHTGAHAEYPGQMLLVWPIKDGPIPDVGKARSIARLIAAHLRLPPHGEHGQHPLVYLHCHAGVNRSALMACLVLLEQGMTPEEAIGRVRERRQGALSDEYADWLLTLEAGGRASGA